MGNDTTGADMRRHWFGRTWKFVAMGVIAVALISVVVMALWNWLMPALFGLPAIGFWQALGLLALTRILFGGLRGGRPHRHWRGRMRERWNRMTPEEREQFMAGMRGRCGRTAHEEVGPAA